MLKCAEQEKVIANERQRRKERLADVQANNVWKYRTVAPQSFSEPLPEHMLRNAVSQKPEIRCLIM